MDRCVTAAIVARHTEAFQQVVRTGTREGNIGILTPLIDKSKAEIVRMGLESNAPLHLT